MELKIKYEQGQELWLMKDNKAVQEKFTDFKVECINEGTAGKAWGIPENPVKIMYGTKQIGRGELQWVAEENLFATKEDLLKSL